MGQKLILKLLRGVEKFNGNYTFYINEKWEKKGNYYDVIGWKERLMSNSGKQLGPDLGESMDRRI